MSSRLILDLARCDQCEDCVVECAYHYRALPTDHGLRALREKATFELVCRRCEEPSCVDACAFAALERGEGGVIERYGLRCVSCLCCAHACPFGTIYPDMLPFYEVPCDYCIGLADGGEPPCVASCQKQGLEYRELGPEESDVHVLDDHLAVRARRWEKHEPKTPEPRP